MLQTLSAKSLAGKMAKSKGTLTLFDLPAIGQREVGLQGIQYPDILPKRMGSQRYRPPPRWSPTKPPAHASSSQKTPPTPSLITTPRRSRPHSTASDRVLRVASRLGCSSVSLKVTGSGKTAEDRAAENLKKVISRAERMEINVLIAPDSRLSSTPEALTSLIRKVGGFRIGAFPDFQTACQSDDTPSYLRSLTPYASVVSASFEDITDEGIHKAFDLDACLDAIMSVGFEGSLSFEYRGKKEPNPEPLRDAQYHRGEDRSKPEEMTRATNREPVRDRDR